MCQISPGPRCWSDSNATARSLTKRLTRAEKDLEANRSAAKNAAGAQDFARFARLRKAEEKLVVKVNDLRREVRHNQRDIDGTKTGLRNLDAMIATCDNADHVRELENRKAQAEALRFQRAHALETKTANRLPVLRIAA
jgi:hypothetical protein